MTAPRSYRTEAVVLRRTERGEADRIVTFFTPEYGKLKAVARGVRKPKSKLAGLVEMFTHSSLQLARGRGMDVVGQGEAIHTFLPLKTDLEKASRAFYVVELVDRFTVEHQENAQLFALLLATLSDLCESTVSDLLLRQFEVGLLQSVGYRPNFHHCVNCGVALEPRTNAFSPAGGGVVCPSCAGADTTAHPVTANAIKLLRLLQDGDYALASRVNIGQQLASELERLLRSHIEYLVERRVRSASFLDRLKDETPGKT